MQKKYFFLKLAIPIAISFWLLDSFIHFYWYDELEFEIIPSDINDLWMRSAILISLTFFGLFADFTSRKTITKDKIKTQTEMISRAKKQWELVVDSLPQLVIAIDDNARIIRVNRTAETWQVGNVNKVGGLDVLGFLKCLNDNCADDGWTSDWPYIWQQIKDKGRVDRKIENEHSGKIYHYSLRNISDYKSDRDQCYAVLIIEDITARKVVEQSLKDHATALQKDVNDRTLELRLTNEQLQHELQVQKAAKEKLKISQECRLSLLRDLFNSQETERKRIAYELHDSIGQSLGATKFKVEELLTNKQSNLFNEVEYKQFNDVVEKIRNIIHEVRDIAMDLRPAMLDDLGVIVTLKWFCREFENTYTGVTVEQLINIEESDIAKERKIVIFRIVQEAMNNIIKHADATNIKLELSKSASGLKLSINDNGCGFDINLLLIKNTNQFNDAPDTPRCSLGLSSMRERAESTNGKFMIETIPDSGTSVTITWGVKPD